MRAHSGTEVENIGTAEYDREIDAALRMSARAKFPEGLANRIHRSLELEAASRPTRKTWLVWMPAACCTAAVAVALGLYVGLSPAKHSRPAHPAGFTFQQSALRNPASNKAVSDSAEMAPMQAATRRELARPVAEKALHKRRRVQQRDAANLFNYPLTHQEKLLLQFARTATPAELKILNPEYQAKVEAKQEAEFAAYVRSGDDSADGASSTTASETVSGNQSTQE